MMEENYDAHQIVSESEKPLDEMQVNTVSAPNDAGAIAWNKPEPVAEEQEEEFVYTSEWLKQNTQIGGWLAFFLVVLGLGGIISGAYPILTLKAADYDGNVMLMASDIISGISFFAIAAYTIYAFVARKPNAVFYGRLYCIMIIVTSIISLIIGNFDEQGLNTMKQAIRGTVWGVIWLIFLGVSFKVGEVIPQEFRKITIRDWMVVAVTVLLPILCFAVGFAQISKKMSEREHQEALFSAQSIASNERTDGKIVFTIPDSCTCSEDMVSEDGLSMKVFTVEQADVGNCVLCSDYDADASKANFESYRKAWTDPQTKGMVEKQIDSGTKSVNGNTCLYKVVLYNVNGGEVYWKYYMLFHQPSGKVAVLSSYDVEKETRYVKELLNSIKFE